MPNLAADLITLLPELSLAVGGMALLMLGVFAGDGRRALVEWLTLGLFALTAVLVLRQPMGVETAAFGPEFVTTTSRAS